MKFTALLGSLLVLAACTEAGEPWHVAPEVAPEPECGDGTCNGDETWETCPEECEAPACGDGVCNGDEDEESCAEDCAGPAPCVDFEDALVVIQENTCLNCHTGTGSGGLDLSTYEGLMNGGTNGEAVLDGDGAASSLVTKLKTDTNPYGSVMPLGNADSVSEEDLQGLIDWINAGANDTCP